MPAAGSSADADASDHRDAESADRGEALDGLLADAPEGVYRFRLRPECGFEFVNRALTEITGFSAEEFLADPDLAMRQVHPDDRHLVTALRERPGGHPRGVEVRWRHRDGHWVWHWVREIGVGGPEGRVDVVTGAVTDVTEYRPTADTRRPAVEVTGDELEGLRRLDELRGSFLGAISHELRTPLTGVVGYARMLEQFGDEMAPEARKDAITRLARNADRLQVLIDDLLDVDHLTESHVIAHRREVELAPLVRSTVETFDTGARDLVLDVDEVTVVVDGAKVARILTHLLRNAERHTPFGTRVIVRGRELVRGGAELEVEDDGPGVPDDRKEEIFAPFSQSDEARHQPNPGIGVGLALVSRYARLHGGTVTLRDTPGGGARFTVTLPGTPAAGDDPADAR